MKTLFLLVLMILTTACGKQGASNAQNSVADQSQRNLAYPLLAHSPAQNGFERCENEMTLDLYNPKYAQEFCSKNCWVDAGHSCNEDLF